MLNAKLPVNSLDVVGVTRRRESRSFAINCLKLSNMFQNIQDINGRIAASAIKCFSNL